MFVPWPTSSLLLLLSAVASATPSTACFSGSLREYTGASTIPGVQQYCASYYPVSAVTSTATATKTTTTTTSVNATVTETSTYTIVQRHTFASISTVYTTEEYTVTTDTTVVVTPTSTATHAKRASTSLAPTTLTTTAGAGAALSSFLLAGPSIVGKVCTCLEVPRTISTTRTTTSTVTVTVTSTTTTTTVKYAVSNIDTTISGTFTDTVYDSTTTVTSTRTVVSAYPTTCSNPLKCPAAGYVDSLPLCGESVDSGDNECHCFQRVNGDNICVDYGLGTCDLTCSTDADCSQYSDAYGDTFVCITSTCCQNTPNGNICVPYSTQACSVKDVGAPAMRRKRSVFNPVFGIYVDRVEL